jgi:ribosomal protein L11 methyltransferase
MYSADETPWVEVSLTVTPELAEAVAEVLSRFIPEGVVVEQLANQAVESELPILKDHVRVFGYLFTDASFEARKQRLEEALWYLGRIQSLPQAKYRPIADRDWMDAWKKHYQPLQVGKKLVILPAQVKKEFPGRLPIRINPGMAFGTGTHPSTQLCLLFLEELIEPGMRFFDVGCGSGILSIAAVLLGAVSAAAVDISPASVQSTIENAQLNGLADCIQVGKDSVPLLLSGYFGDPQASVVAANILTPVILTLLDEGLADLVSPGGHLLLSGILENQADDVIRKAENCGLKLVETRKISDWAGIHLIRPD